MELGCDSQMTAAKPEDPSSVPRAATVEGRTNSYKLSSALRMHAVAGVHAQSHVCMHAHTNATLKCTFHLCKCKFKIFKGLDSLAITGTSFPLKSSLRLYHGLCPPVLQMPFVSWLLVGL